MQEVDFTETDLSAAVLDNCDLQKAVFDNTILEKADLRNSFGGKRKLLVRFTKKSVRISAISVHALHLTSLRKSKSMKHNIPMFLYLNILQYQKHAKMLLARRSLMK